MFKWIRNIFNPPKRLSLQAVAWVNADIYIKQGWTIAKEENNNHQIGVVWLELLEENQ